MKYICKLVAILIAVYEISSHGSSDLSILATIGSGILLLIQVFVDSIVLLVNRYVDLLQLALEEDVRSSKLIQFVLNFNHKDYVNELKEDQNGIAGIADLRDESNREGIRIVIETKRDVSPEVLINQLYKKTALQTSFPANMLALVENEPKLLNIKQALEIYLKHQIDVLIRRVTFDLNADKERKHILEGLHIAISHIDEVIAIIRQSANDEDAASKLKARFGLTDRQTKAILDMRLRTLSGLERDKIEAELKDIIAEIADFEDLLQNHDRQIQNIIERLETLDKKFGDKRRTEIL